MTLSEQAASYADSMMKGNGGDVFTRLDLWYYMKEAYEQGWVDRDTKDVTDDGDMLQKNTDKPF